MTHVPPLEGKTCGIAALTDKNKLYSHPPNGSVGKKNIN
jgi:hypothetical protein